MLQRSNKIKNNCEETRQKITQGEIPKGLSFKTILKHLEASKEPNVLEMFGFLSAKQYRKGTVIKDMGLVSCQLVTQAFANYIVDSLQNSTTAPMDAFRYHATGTGNTSEENSQTSLVVEVESREAGTQEEAGSANIYKSVATVNYTGERSIVEHGLFSSPAGGTMLDRSVFTAVPVISGDSIEFTYQLTVSAET